MMAVGQFDAIFCRNILSSFDKQSAQQVFAALVPQLAPDGFLFLGDSEELPAPIDPLTPVEGVHGLFIHKDNALKKATA
jgi:chemotaxis protein methyltransferase CheR